MGKEYKAKVFKSGNSLALRLFFMLAGKVVIGFADLSMSIDRARNLRQGMRKINEWLRRRSF